MADSFFVLEPVGNGYFLKGGGRADAVMYIDDFSIAAATDVDTDVEYELYTAMIAGFDTDGVDVRDMYMVEDVSTGTWHIRCAAATAFASDAFAKVLFINKAFCTDSGVTSQA